MSEFQISDSVHVLNSESFGQTGYGVHPGTGSVNSLVEHCRLHNNGDIGLFLFGAGRFGTVTSQSWDTGGLIHVSHAHNAIINFFIDCGAIFSSVLIIFLLVGVATAWRVGRRLNSDLYWALFASILGFGVGMATEREIFPTVDNMYVFPIIAMMINLARLRYLEAYHR